MPTLNVPREITVDDLESKFLIVVEVVSPSSADQVRILKPIRYARAGIPGYWCVERAEDDEKDPLIFKYKLQQADDGKPTYVETGVVRLSALEKGVITPR